VDIVSILQLAKLGLILLLSQTKRVNKLVSIHASLLPASSLIASLDKTFNRISAILNSNKHVTA